MATKMGIEQPYEKDWRTQNRQINKVNKPNTRNDSIPQLLLEDFGTIVMNHKYHAVIPLQICPLYIFFSISLKIIVIIFLMGSSNITPN